MATYTRRTRIRAPLERVWEFHAGPAGLEALTPEWMGLTVEAVRGPNGERDPDVLDRGSLLRMSLRPFGVGPRRRWVSRIVARERDEGSAYFRDEMEGGPFPRWVHTHRFFGDGDETVLEDVVEYDLPGGGLGRTLAPLSYVGFEPVFRYRHRKTRELLE